MEVIRSFVLTLIILSFCTGIFNMLLPDGNIKKVCMLVLSLFFFINIINFIKNIDFKSEDIIERFNIYEQEADNENIRRQNEIMLSGVTSSLEMQIAADVSEFLGSESAVNITSVIAEEKAVIEKISVVHNTDKNEDMIKEFLYNKYHIAKEKIEVVKGE